MRTAAQISDTKKETVAKYCHLHGQPGNAGRHGNNRRVQHYAPHDESLESAFMKEHMMCIC